MRELKISLNTAEKILYKSEIYVYFPIKNASVVFDGSIKNMVLYLDIPLELRNICDDTVFVKINQYPKAFL